MIEELVLALALVPMSVPDGKYILVNGLLGAGEWDGAASVRLDAETEVRVKKDRESLFLAVVFKRPRHTGVDLCLRSAGKVRMLHVSSALGEGELREGQWSELQWGRNQWWTANPVALVNEQGKQGVSAPEAFEFQLARAQLGREVELYFHLKRPEKQLPAGASEDTTDRWLRFTLG
ncbi:MAG TPA: hypothetical protein VFD58_02885 [Blastocatellia bacterium]|nr:hypothetical protein [Blastocatellia bacterium]